MNAVFSFLIKIELYLNNYLIFKMLLVLKYSRKLVLEENVILDKMLQVLINRMIVLDLIENLLL